MNPTEEQIKLAISLGGFWVNGIGPNGEEVKTLECCDASKSKWITYFRADNKLPHYQITPIDEVIEQLKVERQSYRSQVVR